MTSRVEARSPLVVVGQWQVRGSLIGAFTAGAQP